METPFDLDKFLAAAAEAVADPAAASRTSNESLFKDVVPAAAPQTPVAPVAAAPAPVPAAAAPAAKPPLPPAPKWPNDAVPEPPWRAVPTTAAKTRPPQPKPASDPRVKMLGNSYKCIRGQWQNVASDRPMSSAEKAGVVFPAVRPVAPPAKVASRVAPRVVPPRVAAPPAKVASVEAVVSVAAPEEVAPAPATVETPAPAQAPATAAAAAKTAACPFQAYGIPLPPPAVVPTSSAALDADAAQRSIEKRPRRGPRGTNENSQWHTMMHRAKLQGPAALCAFYAAWPKPQKKQKTQPEPDA